MKTAGLWDIFCKVVDNYGDIGVCWRLAADLASRGLRVRLWTDDGSALAWMAPGVGECRGAGVQVLQWQRSSDASPPAGLEPADVWIEGFGCGISPGFLRHRFSPAGGDTATAPVWINLEYLSAEPFVERSHGLPSPVLEGPARGTTKHFFYPGFTAGTGGLLRERNLAQRQSAFSRANWLASQGIPWSGERLISLFCYEPAALPSLLALLQADTRHTRLLITDGRAAEAVAAALQGQASAPAPGGPLTSLATTFLPRLTQTDFDHMLWSCDLNFVRGEDSLVRALWAGRPLVWQIYAQDDQAHHAKLEAYLEAVQAPAPLRHFHRTWNGLDHQPLMPPDLPGWGESAVQAKQHLMLQSDLTSRLLAFVERQLQTRRPAPEKR